MISLVIGCWALRPCCTPCSGGEAEESWALAVAQRTVAVRTRGADRWVDATMDQGVPTLGQTITGELAEATAML